MVRRIIPKFRHFRIRGPTPISRRPSPWGFSASARHRGARIRPVNCPPERFTTEWITVDAGAAGPMTGGAPPVPAGARRSSASASWMNLSTRAREMGDASRCDRSPGPLRNDAGNDAPRHRAPLAYRREGQRGDDHERPRPMRLLHVRQGRSEGRPLCLPAQIGVGPGQPPEPYDQRLAPSPRRPGSGPSPAVAKPDQPGINLWGCVRLSNRLPVGSGKAILFNAFSYVACPGRFACRPGHFL